MPELNFELLQQNIRELISNKGITQAQLAEIAGMTQANVSKALNKNEKKQFTLDQIFRISQHFSISIDELVGNKSADEASMSPRSILAFLTPLLSAVKAKTAKITVEEEVYEPYYDRNGYDCAINKKKVEYPAVYFPDYCDIWDFADNEHEAEDVHSEFLCGGNSSRYQCLNSVLRDFIPVIDLYRKHSIEEEPFKMVLKGYLNKLPER